MKGVNGLQDMDQIYREHAKTVYKFLCIKTQNAAWAEELTQETFYRAIYSLDSYNGKCSITTWLCQIAKHIWQQELEKKSKHPTAQLDDAIPAFTIQIDEQIIQAEQKARIIKALHCLGEPAREVLYLRLFGEVSFNEIGEVFGQSETWARVTFFRGKKQLLKGDLLDE